MSWLVVECRVVSRARICGVLLCDVLLVWCSVWQWGVVNRSGKRSAFCTQIAIQLSVILPHSSTY